MESSSNLLDTTKNQSWQDLPQSEQRKSASLLIQAVEDSAKQVASRMESVPQAPIINIEVNIGMFSGIFVLTLSEILCREALDEDINISYCHCSDAGYGS